MNNLKCPITGSKLIFVGEDEHCRDGNSYYSPIDNPKIVYSVWPRRANIYTLENNDNPKKQRYFLLKEDDSWTEMKRVPHGDGLFPKKYYGIKWKKACAEALVRYQKRLEQIEYWKEHPEEDPRVFAKLISFDLVEVRPMGPPSGILYFHPSTIKND